jgi:hypothetical protein
VSVIASTLMGHKDGGPVITRYKKVATDAEQQISEAVEASDSFVHAERGRPTSGCPLCGLTSVASAAPASAAASAAASAPPASDALWRMLMFSLRFLLYPLENFDAVRRGVASYTPSQFAHDALVQLLGLPRASKPIFVVALAHRSPAW